MIRPWVTLIACAATPLAAAAALPASTDAFLDTHCAGCHNDVDKEANLSLESLTFAPSDPANFQTWTRIYERVAAGEMPPAKKRRPEAVATASFLRETETALVRAEAATLAEGRATRRRLNAYEYENTLRDLLAAPWLQIRGLFPEDGEAQRFNKLAEALDVSHVHLARYMNAADHAIRQVVSAQWHRPPTRIKRYYARDQRTLTSKFTQNPFNSSPDRQTYPLLGFDPQPAVRAHEAPLTVGDHDPAQRELEAVGWVSSNYVTGFTYRWDQFRAPVSGRYRIRFSGYTMWCAPGGISRRFANDRDAVGSIRPPNKLTPNYDALSRGRRDEPITVYTRNGVLNRRVGEFDLTPEPSIHDLGEVWLVANETLVPDASRFYRSRPNNFRNPLMQEDGCPSVAFRWMEVEGPLTDETTAAGYRLLFGDLPLRAAKDGKGITVDTVPTSDTRESGRRGGQRVEPTDEKTVEVVSENPTHDAERLIRAFLARVYRRPAAEPDVARFLALVAERRAAGLSFTEAMVAGYTAILASPRFVFLDEPPGRLDDTALATRLALFLSNSAPDAHLLELAAAGRLRDAATLRREVDRLLDDPKSARFVEAFLDYWIDARKVEDTTPSTTLYNDYYLDDALTEAALAETRQFFTSLLQENLPTRNLISSNFTFLNERLRTLRDPGREGDRHATRRPAARFTARRTRHAGPRAQGHRQWHHDLTGSPRQMDQRADPGPRCATATPSRSRRTRHPRRRHPPAATGTTPGRSLLRFLPHPHRSRRIRPREFRYPRRLARPLPRGRRGQNRPQGPRQEWTTLRLPPRARSRPRRNLARRAPVPGYPRIQAIAGRAGTDPRPQPRETTPDLRHRRPRSIQRPRGLDPHQRVNARQPLRRPQPRARDRRERPVPDQVRSPPPR